MDNKKSHPERKSPGGADAWAIRKIKRNGARPVQKWNDEKEIWER